MIPTERDVFFSNVGESLFPHFTKRKGSHISIPGGHLTALDQEDESPVHLVVFVGAPGGAAAAQVEVTFRAASGIILVMFGMMIMWSVFPMRACAEWNVSV